MSEEEKVKIISINLAEMYAYGWQQYGFAIGEMKSNLSPNDWAKINHELFVTEAYKLYHLLQDGFETIT